MSTLLFFSPGWTEIVVVAFVGLLLFGRRLPEVGRSVGRAIVEFKKGVRGIEDEVDNATYNTDYSSSSSSRPVPDAEQEEATAPKFEPPESAPSTADD